MTQKKTRLSDSLEDYLEIILALEKSNKVARVKDIAGEMGVLQHLRAQQLPGRFRGAMK
jgi:DtxR family Mn-dependent transcriptional regulator